MIQSNDGGANVSLDGGRTWSTQTNQPTAEIYQVAVDNQYPYRVYGAQQDNTTVIVPSLPLGNGQDSASAPAAKPAPSFPTSSNPDVVYGSCKGQFSRRNLNTTDEERYWIGAESLYGNGGEAHLPLPARLAHGSLAARSAHRLLRLAIRPPHARRRRHLGNDQSRSHRPPRRHAGRQRRTHHPRRHRRRGLQHPLFHPRIAPAKGPHLGRLQRWPDPRHPRRRQNLDQRHAPKASRPAGACRTSNPAHTIPAPPTSPSIASCSAISRPYIYRTDDFGKTWTLLTDGKNGIAADEPTRVVREDPDRAGLLYAGTEFGMYISFDNGAHWQSFQLNLPNTPVTDIKVAHQDLVVATQGRSFWILDNLTLLHQFGTGAPPSALLFKPREAIRSTSRGGGGRGATIQYPQPGAAIDYYLASAPAGDITMEILDASNIVIRKFTSAGAAAPETPAVEVEAAPNEDSEGGGGRFRSGPTRLDKTPGMHRFTWDLRYPGAWASPTRPESPNGPAAVPGRYFVRLTVGTWNGTQPFTVIEDPRITGTGVTLEDLREQFDHNIKVRDLVSDVNRTVSRVRAGLTALAGKPDSAATLASLKDLAASLITPTIRYSKPELQTHITYLYSETNATDQKVGRDAIERYNALRKELDQRIAELDKLLK